MTSTSVGANLVFALYAGQCWGSADEHQVRPYTMVIRCGLIPKEYAIPTLATLAQPIASDYNTLRSSFAGTSDSFSL